LTCADLDAEDVAASKISISRLFVDPPAAKEAFVEASRIAHAAQREVA